MFAPIPMARSESFLIPASELSWNRSDFYDIFGPTKRSLKGIAAVGGYVAQSQVQAWLVAEVAGLPDNASVSELFTSTTR